MNDDRRSPRHDDPSIPEQTYDDDVSLADRNTSSPEATAARGTSGGSLRLLFLILATVVIVAIVLLLSGAIDLGGDAPQADDIGEPIPGLLTPENVP